MAIVFAPASSRRVIITLSSCCSRRRRGCNYSTREKDGSPGHTCPECVQYNRRRRNVGYPLLIMITSWYNILSSNRTHTRTWQSVVVTLVFRPGFSRRAPSHPPSSTIRCTRARHNNKRTQSGGREHFYGPRNLRASLKHTHKFNIYFY